MDDNGDVNDSTSGPLSLSLSQGFGTLLSDAVLGTLSYRPSVGMPVGTGFAILSLDRTSMGIYICPGITMGNTIFKYNPYIPLHYITDVEGGKDIS